MCGIAGFSLAPKSSINARTLAHNLLAEIEYRGSHASGFGFINGDSLGFHKDAVPGSQLPLKSLPRNAKTVVLHTRFATQGDVKDNTNNHPVISPNGRIGLVHNGVITNDDELRLTEELFPFKDKIAAVDSAVIPAVLQEVGTDGFAALSGYAAVSWIDIDDGPILNVAVLKDSPVVWTQLADGSFVFASTEPLLHKALEKSGLWHGGVFAMERQQHISVMGGILLSNDKLPAMKYTSYNYNRYKNATSGGHGTTTKPATTPAKRSATMVTTGTTEPAKGGGWRGYSAADDDALWEAADPTNEELKELEALTTDADAIVDSYYNNFGEWIGEGEEPDPDLSDPMFQIGQWPNGKENSDQFYLLSHDGEYVTYRTLFALESALRWHAGIVVPEKDQKFPEAVGNVRWAEHFIDLGAIDAEGKQISWVLDPEDTLMYDGFSMNKSESNQRLAYIREGAKFAMSLLTGDDA